MNKRIAVVIPAFNEEDSIALVLQDIPDIVEQVIVVNNNSSDNTAAVAKQHGAHVVDEPRAGYGQACLAGIEALHQSAIDWDYVVFLDGDYSDHPEELIPMLAHLETQQADMLIGSRALGNMETGAMLPQQIFGNWLATTLIRWIYGFRYTDLGPFRIIRWSALKQLGMQDTNFGWTVEMQIKALQQQLRIVEFPVSYRKRIGVSKITGTISGTFGAGYKILYTIFKYAW